MLRNLFFIFSTSSHLSLGIDLSGSRGDSNSKGRPRSFTEQAETSSAFSVRRWCDTQKQTLLFLIPLWVISPGRMVRCMNVQQRKAIKALFFLVAD